MPTRAQYLIYEYSRLPTPISSLLNASGQVRIGFDGKGLWWIERISIFASSHIGEEEIVPRDDFRWEAISKAIDTGRADDIAKQINERLTTGGAHMMLFGEHRPNDLGNRAAPPYSRRLRLAA